MYALVDMLMVSHGIGHGIPRARSQSKYVGCKFAPMSWSSTNHNAPDLAFDSRELPGQIPTTSFLFIIIIFF